MTSLTVIPLVTKLSSKVIRILGCNPGPMTLQGTNTYLVGTGHRRVLIDSGDEDTAPQYTKLLEDVLEKEKATIEHLIVTHWHHDHIGGIEPVQKLLASKAQTKYQSLKIWKLPRSLADKENSENDCNEQWTSLQDNQLIEVEGAKLVVKHTPGHTTDHACLLLLNDNVLFSGDCILGEGTTVFEDLHDYMLSLENILKMAPYVIYPGHGPVVEDPDSRIRQYIEHRLKRESAILKVLQDSKNPMTEMDIVKCIYKETPEYLWQAAASNVNHHLQKLLKEHKVLGETGSWCIVT
ncbi:endoribonuclease LACTB2 [Orussus abietinus]|uniref:endoribonuclease LACTB2 n=1 Tax=Orussus abietinus TaxID=222816 RepID=UPI00062692A6|nr:endoribonuclease LACTB2 [Orussus abietinus]XP_012276038.1 endoribonuclease LACTB2 [Orussus abietinus]XP_012276047.1 endoribonuclease LACTB2 [Orussus abietinus]XP_012276056.1 endoribonuclease LACTB2 [Orussus abietinus]XP_012276064.1 endoribonuclease LACTB2 [Orussus abietinus]XP_023289176.1 endoribonuclease LACTB2 [Orussus abietinus]XP_023289177.1 endoribonuclease LACTB2 [Orussus abietinus]